MFTTIEFLLNFHEFNSAQQERPLKQGEGLIKIRHSLRQNSVFFYRMMY